MPLEDWLENRTVWNVRENVTRDSREECRVVDSRNMNSFRATVCETREFALHCMVVACLSCDCKYCLSYMGPL